MTGLIGLSLGLALFIAVIGSWLMIELYRTGKTARLLWFIVPVLVAVPLAFFHAGTGLLGYATSQTLTGKFQLLNAQADDEKRTVFVLVRRAGEDEPRLYAISDNYEKNKKEFGLAQEKINQDLPVEGEMEGGEGPDHHRTYRLGVMPPVGLPPKQGFTP